MTEPQPFPTDDELADIVDGTASPEVLERLAGDPEAQQRVRDVEDTIARLRSTPAEPLDEPDIEHLIDRALDAAGAEDPEAVAVPLRRMRPIHRIPVWAVAAVVVAIAAIGLGLVWSGTRSDDGPRETASTDRSASRPSAEESAGDEDFGARPDDADSADDDSMDGDAANGDAVGDGGAAPEAAPNDLGDPVDLGDHPDVAALRSTLADGFPTEGSDPATPSDSVPTSAEVSRCAVQVFELYTGEGLEPTPENIGVATIVGETVLVYEYGIPDGDHGHLLSIVTPLDCDPQATFVRD